MMTAKGMIGIPAGEHARWTAFHAALMKLTLPPNMTMADVEIVRGCSSAGNRNKLVTKAIETGVDWVFFLDDDMICRPDTLVRLLAHNQDIVVGLSYTRDPPFLPLWFTQTDPTTKRVTLLTHQEIRTDGQLQPIAGCTSGGLLVRTRVFRGLASPYWTLGQFIPDEWHDDVWFCELSRAGGFQIYGDPTVQIGHITNVDVWPNLTEDGEHGVLLARGHKLIAGWRP